MKVLLLCVCMLVIRPAFANQSSIHEMLMDGRIMGLAENRQLTLKSDGEILQAKVSPNGRSVAYYARDATGNRTVSIVKVSGGSSAVLVKERKRPDISKPWEDWIPFERDMHFAWSPDSRFLAFPATHFDMPADVAYDLEPDPCILVYNASGSGRALLTLPEKTRNIKSLCWSPDGSKLAAVLTINGPDSSGIVGERDDVVVFNVAANSMQTLASHTKVCTKPGARPELYKPILQIPWTSLAVKSWSSNGKLVHFSSEGMEDGKVVTSLMEAGLDGKETRSIEERCPERLSPDGTLIASDSYATIKNRTTGDTIELFKEPIKAEFLGWAPSGKILVYQHQPQELKDDKGKRSRPLRSLWLAAVEDNPINHMCVALDSEPGSIPTWSRDCKSMAYICDGCLYLAQFSTRELEVSDKIAAGLPLTEEEEKESLLNDAKILGAGIARFMSDWDDKFPDADDFIQQLLPYLQGLGENLFFRPGTETMAFQYFPPSGPVESPADTIVGMFDVGYGWQVILYADGHVQIVPK